MESAFGDGHGGTDDTHRGADLHARFIAMSGSYRRSGLGNAEHGIPSETGSARYLSAPIPRMCRALNLSPAESWRRLKAARAHELRTAYGAMKIAAMVEG